MKFPFGISNIRFLYLSIGVFNSKLQILIYQRNKNKIKINDDDGSLKNIRDFEQAREYVRTLGIKSANGWKKYWKKEQKPDDIPYNPDREYKNKEYAVDSSRFWFICCISILIHLFFYF